MTTGSVTDGFTVTNTPYEPVEVTLEVTKELKGRDWETDDSFEFTLAKTDDDPMPEAGGETVTVTKNEPTGKFGTIEFLKKGIEEINGYLAIDRSKRISYFTKQHWDAAGIDNSIVIDEAIVRFHEIEKDYKVYPGYKSVSKLS